MKRLIWSALAVLLVAVPCVALAAQDGYVTDNVSLRAGPNADYPLIDVIPEGSQVYIQGCTDGWEWCDVIAGGNRGWVDGYYVESEYNDRRVLLPNYGASIGIPIISFAIGAYWDRYYRHRPFYGDRVRWSRHHFVRRPPPRPSHGRGYRSDHRGDYRQDHRGDYRAGHRPDVRATHILGRSSGPRPQHGPVHRPEIPHAIRPGSHPSFSRSSHYAPHHPAAAHMPSPRRDGNRSAHVPMRAAHPSGGHQAAPRQQHAQSHAAPAQHSSKGHQRSNDKSDKDRRHHH